ncbi:MAG: glycoside hydrolase [Oscillochloris sp.]|nr:glycoside hydrolase [Oscillochloris sp.]
MYLDTLTTDWQIRPLDEFRQGIYPSGDEGWLAAQVPGHWQQIPGLEHHAGKAVYRCRFTAPAVDPALPRRWLRINGAFYHMRSYLNGIDLGAHRGYFIPFEREASMLRADENELIVELDCPDERDKTGKTMITGVFSHWDCIAPGSNPGGLWLPVELHASGPLRLDHARLRTVTVVEDIAQIRFDLMIDAAIAGPADVVITFTPRTFDGAIQRFVQRRKLRKGRQDLGGLFKLRDPRLWWTHDLGRPDLYDVQVELHHAGQLSDATTVTFGVRKFELRDWIPHLNGERFLIKGNNYPPGDVRIATVTRERVEHDLKLAQACHMNMLRIHAHVDHPVLYEAADCAGMLLWQDFPLQWLYDETVLEDARSQAVTMARLLGSHPSIAVWCMHNEPFLIEDTADESLTTRLLTYATGFGFNWNRDVMDTQLKELVEAEDPTRPVVRSSGELNLPGVRPGTDTHAYFGWYRNYGTLDAAEQMIKRLPANLRFVTEFGAQSFPNLANSLRFMPAEIKQQDVEQLAARHGFQPEIMDHWIPWRDTGSLAATIALSQAYQSEINRYYIDRLRYYKYRPTGGIVPFLLVDPYPAVLWSILDYWREPKQSYYAMQTAFRPQYAFCLLPPKKFALGEPIELPIYAVNDARRAMSGLRVRSALHDPAGVLIAETVRLIDLPADCTTREVDRLRLTPPHPGEYSLTISFSGGEYNLEHRYRIPVG